MNIIRIGILGYGNIGKGVELAIGQNPDTKLVAVFTRRTPSELALQTKDALVVHMDNIDQYTDKIDVMILCGGSLSDLPIQGPAIAEKFTIVDSFDTHAKIPEYLAEVGKQAIKGGKVALISAGWDPGLFSMIRLLSASVLPEGNDYTFWGKGVSQGHSDAIRRVEGVADAVQYTIPVDAAVEAVRDGTNPVFTTRQKHTRSCFVVAKEGADLNEIEETIKAMPNYFADYDTTVAFISQEELKKNHAKMPHAGFVFRSGATDNGKNSHVIEYALKLESNAQFTASVLVSFARAAARLATEGKTGGFTPFDIPLSYLSAIPRDELIKNLL